MFASALEIQDSYRLGGKLGDLPPRRLKRRRIADSPAAIGSVNESGSSSSQVPIRIADTHATI
jgi:hypothetical protein